MIIPLELWMLIAYELQVQRNRESLLSLCLTTKSINADFTPILYSQVELRAASSVLSFYHTMKDSGTKLGPLIQGITIGSYRHVRHWDRVHIGFDLAKILQSALMSLPNLRELTSVMDPDGFRACFINERNTDTGTDTPVNFPFSLHKLVLPTMHRTSVPLFFSSQPSIKELYIESEGLHGNIYITGFLSRSSGCLPNLTSITARTYELTGAVPGRPISQIMIVTEMLERSGEIIVTQGQWMRVLQGSTVPITTIGFYRPPRSHDLWDQLIPALKQFGVDKTLESIRVVEALEPPVTEESRQEALFRRVNQMKILTGFDRLESIEFGEMLYATLPTTDVLRWLGNMGDLNAWKEFVPSLKQVKMYGVYIS
ncbi:unnamed protein product [Rhizoctonia solani]|uniref:Uncharacterized protein n=1 Tax=Rhizoctonia solani TaxID=456999 RepID=A0A8H2WPB3_9AGAM|nr:unnamed protein product [Rhizoctonia solani]